MDERLKYLDYLQGLINRMAANSFVAKGWSVTLVTAVLGFAAKENNSRIALIALVPCVAFWILDAFYLSLERQFRNVFEHAVGEQGGVTFRMRALPEERVPLARTLPALPIAALHGSLLAAVIAVTVRGWMR